MTRVFDRIVIAVADLTEAVAHYQTLFGVVPYYRIPANGEQAAAWWAMSNTVIELAERDTTDAYIAGIVINTPHAVSDSELRDNSLGLDIRLDDGQRTTTFRSRYPESHCSQFTVDHLVLRTNDADACIEFFGAQLGLRLALDKTASDWGGRMLFFRAGKLTLEVIQSQGEEEIGNFFWGIAYQCADIEHTVSQLRERGVAVSDIRAGRKAGTRVVSLKSHCLHIPTLLIEPVT